MSQNLERIVEAAQRVAFNDPRNGPCLLRDLAAHVLNLEGRLDALTEQPALATPNVSPSLTDQWDAAIAAKEKRESVAPATAPEPDPSAWIAELPLRKQMIRAACEGLDPSSVCRYPDLKICLWSCRAPRAVDAILGMIKGGAK